MDCAISHATKASVCTAGPMCSLDYLGTVEGPWDKAPRDK